MRSVLGRTRTALLVLAAAVGGVAAISLQPGARVFLWDDAMFTALAADHLQGVLLRGGDWTRGPFAWPIDGAVSQVDWLLGPALLGLPARLLGVDPLDGMNLLVALGLLLSTLAWWAVARVLLGPGPHAWLAGLAGGLHPLALTQAPYLNLVHRELVIGGPLLLGLGLHRRAPGLAFGGGALAAAAAWFGFYQGAQALVVAVVVLGAAALARVGDRRAWLAAAMGLAIGALPTLPVAQVYQQTATLQGVSPDLRSLAGEAWDLSHPLRLGRGSTPAATAPIGQGGGPAIVLATPWLLALAAVGLLALPRQRPRWAWAAVLLTGIAGAWLALGPTPGGPLAPPPLYRLLMEAPGLANLRAPSRWLVLPLGAVGLLAALGARELVGRLARRWPRAAFLALLPPLLFCLGLRSLPGEPRAAVAPDPVYALLEGLPSGALVEVTNRSAGQTCSCTLGQRFHAAMQHRRPLVGGVYARRLQSLVDLDRAVQGWPQPEVVGLLRRVGATVVIEHGLGPAPDPAAATCTEAGRHRVCALVEPPIALPAPDALVVVREPPVTALRWRRGQAPRDSVTVRCGEEEQLVSAQPWRVLSALRYGPASPALEVVLDAPCPVAPTVSGVQPEWLRAEGAEQAWLPAL